MDVFVSYASVEKTVADAAVATLERAGVRCWYAPRDIRPGAPYGEAIVDGIRACRVLVVIVSSRALGSRFVLGEVERAVHYGLTIVPLRIEDVEMSGAFELFLSSPHWLDALAPPLEAHLDRLCRAVTAVLRDDPASPSTRARGAATRRADASPHQPAPVSEVSPDQWSRRPGGRLRQFFGRLLDDQE